MNYKLAFALGTIPLGTVGREPVAWLYNGITAPVLPVSNYAYAFMYTTIEGQHAVWIGDVGANIPSVVSNEGGRALAMPAPVSVYGINRDTGEWYLTARHTTVTTNAFIWMIEPYWSNVDIEGVVSASKPVPIYN